MGRATEVLLLLAVVVPVTAYVAGSLAQPGAPAPADHSPVILRDAPGDAPDGPSPARPAAPPPGREVGGGDSRDGARVVAPRPTPVGEDDDDEQDDDGPDDDDTDQERDDDARDDGDD